jgi:hypothetical protein
VENSEEDEEIARKRKGMLGKRKEKEEMGMDRLLVIRGLGKYAE